MIPNWNEILGADPQVIVVGGGLVGAATALALVRQGLRVALVEARPPGPADARAAARPDARVYTLSPGSVAWLEELGVWPPAEPGRATAVYAMEVYGDAGGGLLPSARAPGRLARLEFDALEAGLKELAWVVEEDTVLAPLWRALEACDRVQLVTPARPRAVAWGNDGVRLFLDGVDKPLHAELLVGADGARSWVRRQAGLDGTPRSYDRTGVIARLVAERPHRHRAFQWFLPGGEVMAWLPLPDGEVSLVWSATEARARALLAADAGAFAAMVTGAGGRRLGGMRLRGAPGSFPLQLLRLDRLVREGVALVGDAAHVIHPLAGQGVNLGFQDARRLAATLAARGPAPCGDPGLLARYDRARLAELRAMQGLTDGLQRLFASPLPGLRWARNAGLAGTGASAWLRALLARQAVR